MKNLRYFLFAALFAFVIIGLITRSYALLAAFIVVAIVLGVIADKLESAPTEPFKQNNQLHHRHH
ncbi:hypothetical protein LLE49_07075 [Alicyclobacillus tolerans]|uniref:hypothetical protein n=1 Tax=Alicyclobacillus tolerans TaxID=90970 RepID=UPI001F2DF60A|nr:hypothetical protein [Alicyclobacillus tolerans]MCF8564509.1 hypothetical protein [Alicyclobacillus tolerans]